MKKILNYICKIFCGILGITFLVFFFGSAISYFEIKKHPIGDIIFSLIFLLLGIVLLKVAVRKQLKEHLFNQNPTTEKEISSSSDQYITLGNSIVHTDNSPITDEEIPYLMQLGYEESLRQTGQYNGEVLDASFVVQSLAEKKNATIIPAYQEIINFPTNCSSNIFSTDIFFLKYINGRSVENANIAQYWYYEYGLNYANELKKLYSSDILRISNVNISKLKVADLFLIPSFPPLFHLCPGWLILRQVLPWNLSRPFY